MKVGKPIEGVLDFIFWIYLFPIMLLIYIYKIGEEVERLKQEVE